MIEGLNEKARLSVDVVLENVAKLRRDLNDIKEDLGRDTPKAVRELDRDLKRLEGTFNRVGDAASGAGNDMAKEATEAQTAWNNATKELAELQRRYAEFRQGQVTGVFTDDAASLSDLADQHQRALDIQAAAQASLTGDIQAQRRAEQQAIEETRRLEEAAYRARVQQDQIYNQLLSEQEQHVRRVTQTALDGIQAEHQARVAAYSAQMAMAQAAERAEAERRDSARYAGGWGSIGQGTANARNSAALNNRPSPFMVAEAQRSYQEQETREFNEQMRRRVDAMNAEAEAIARQDAAQEKLNATRSKSTGHLITERYALYDVATTTGGLALALGLLVAAYEAVAISREKAFADVTRVSGMDRDSAEAGELRDELVQLTKEIPLAFEDISRTTQLLSQQNVDARFLDEATESVIKFSTTTGIASDTATEDLGKLSNILGLGAKGYETLGNSIAYAGAKSAATEPQIIAVAKEIAPYARDAGFAEHATIGLATALASLAVPPERARSAIASLFTTIDRNVSSGGERLANFARVSGMSVDQFVEQWSSDPAAVFQAFINGTSSIQDLTGAFDALGIDGRLAGTVMRALQSDTVLLAESFANARDGLSNGFLDASFEQMISTVAAKLQLLLNGIQNLADSIGGPTLAALGNLIQFFADGANNLSAFIDNMGPWGGAIGTVITVVALLVGGLLLLTAVLAGGAASVYAITTAITLMDGRLTVGQARVANFTLGLIGMRNAAITAAPAVASVGTAGEAAGKGLTAAGVGAKVLRGALISTGIGAIAVLIGSLAGGFLDAGDAQDDMADSVENATGAIGAEAETLDELIAGLREAVDASNELALSQADLEESLFELGKSIGENGSAFSAYSEGGRTNMRALQQAISSAAELAGGDAQALANLLLGLEQQLIQAGASDEALQMVRRALDATGASASRALVTSNSLAVGLGVGLDNAAKEAGKSINGLGKEVRTVADYARDLSSVFNRSLEIRFGPTQAYDAILRKYSEMRQSARDAANGIDDLRNEIRATEAELLSIRGTRTGLEYGLSIASQYGDTIRVAQISGEIARLNAQEGEGKSKLTDLNQQLVEQQDALNLSLVGNSDAAIRNREDVYALVDAYAEYLNALALSGASQAELEAAARNLSLEFGNNLTAMGFNRDEINGQFAPAVQGLGDIIAGMPREVSFEILGLDAAQAALQEHLLKMKEAVQGAATEIASAMQNANAAAGDSFARVTQGAQENLPGAAEEARKATEDIKWNWADTINWLASSVNAVLVEGIWGTAKNIADSIRETIGWLFGGKAPDLAKIWSYDFGKYYQAPGSGIAGLGWGSYDDGGFTGIGGRNDVAGFVHKGEYVFPQEAVRYYGVENLGRAHRAALGGRGYAMGGLGGSTPGPFGAAMMGGGSQLSLTQETVDRIIEAAESRPIYLMADSRVIAQVVSAGNAAYTRSS